MPYCTFINVTTNEIYTQAEDLTSACYRKHISKIIPTLFQSKSFTFRVPKSHSLETNANLAIRPKMIISSVLVLIPVIH